MTPSVPDLDPAGEEAAARAIWDQDPHRFGFDHIRVESLREDYLNYARAAITAYLRAVPESDEQRDKADQWDAAQPMIAAMTDVVVVARKMHTVSRVRLLNAYDWMELTNALNAVTRLSPDEAAGGE